MPDQDSNVFEEDGRYYERRTWKSADGRWSQIPDLLAQDRRLSANARWAYVLLLSAARRTNGGSAGWVEYPEEWLARDLGATEKSVRSWIAQLEAAGFLEIDKAEVRGPNGRKTPKSYLVYEPDEVDYVVEITRSQALNARQFRTPKSHPGPAEASTTTRHSAPAPEPVEKTIGNPGQDNDANYRPLSNNHSTLSTNEYLVHTKKEVQRTKRIDSRDHSVSVSSSPQEQADRPSDGLNATGEAPTSRSITEGSSVAIGDRLGKNPGQDAEIETIDQPSFGDLISNAVSKLEFSDRPIEPNVAGSLRAMDIAELREMALRDPDAAYVVDSLARQDDVQRWVDLLVNFARQFIKSNGTS